MLYISPVLRNGPHICESKSYTLKSSWKLETGLQMLKFYKHRGHLDTSNRSAKLDEVNNTGGVILDTRQGSANVKQSKTFTHINHRGHYKGVSSC